MKKFALSVCALLVSTLASATEVQNIASSELNVLNLSTQSMGRGDLSCRVTFDRAASEPAQAFFRGLRCSIQSRVGNLAIDRTGSASGVVIEQMPHCFRLHLTTEGTSNLIGHTYEAVFVTGTLLACKISPEFDVYQLVDTRLRIQTLLPDSSCSEEPIGMVEFIRGDA